MESAKRKREADGAVGDRREVTDEEVEEFYAILGRIREATRCHSATPSSNAVGGGGGGGVRWRPAFAWEDFAVRDDGVAPLKITAAEGEGEGESAAPRRIDLNAEPEPEPEPEPKPKPKPKPEPEMGSPPGEVTVPSSSMRA